MKIAYVCMYLYIHLLLVLTPFDMGYICSLWGLDRWEDHLLPSLIPWVVSPPREILAMGSPLGLDYIVKESQSY